jgi:hypothetical protein
VVTIKLLFRGNRSVYLYHPALAGRDKTGHLRIRKWHRQPERRAGLSAIVVARDGTGYEVADWARSKTFRLGTQSGLILTDNRSREFDSMSPAERIVHARITWGDYLKRPAPKDFPDFDYRFARRSLSPSRTGPIRHVPPLESDLCYRICRLGLRAMRVVALSRSPDQARAVLRGKMRRIVRAALPQFRRLDDQVAEDVQVITRLEAEIATYMNASVRLQWRRQTSHDAAPEADPPRWVAAWGVAGDAR